MKILKSHKDIITVPSEINNMIKEYEEVGYLIKKTTPISFNLILNDGEVKIWWENGLFYFQ